MPFPTWILQGAAQRSEPLEQGRPLVWREALEERSVRRREQLPQAFGGLCARLGETQQAESAIARVTLPRYPSLLLQLLHEAANAALLQGQRGAQLLLGERRAFG